MFAYDDIAYNMLNPYPGQIFNTREHFNVYPSHEAINFTGRDVNAQQIYKSLINLPTTSEDYLFIYYNDHGSFNQLAIPTGNGESMYSWEIANVLDQMEMKGLFKKCLFVIESCYAGTIALQSKNPNVAFITSSSDTQTSYTEIFDIKVDNTINAQLSSAFMYFMDRKSTLSVGDFHKIIKPYVIGSDAVLYSSQEFQKENMSDFIGLPATETTVERAVLLSNDDIPRLLRGEVFETIDEDSKRKHNENIESMKTLSIRLDNVIKYIITSLDSDNISEYYKLPKSSTVFKDYQDVSKAFYQYFGEINPNDGLKLIALYNVCLKHKKDNIIRTIIEATNKY